MEKDWRKKEIIIMIIIVIAMFIISEIHYSITETYRQDLYEHNIEVLHDSIDYYITEKDDLVAKKKIYQTTITDLEKLNGNLKGQIEQLKTKNKLISGANFSGQIEQLRHDTTYIIKRDTIYKDFIYDFNFDNKWRELNGKIKYNNDTINLLIANDIVNFDYTLGIDDKYNIYIKSDCPYVKYNQIEGFAPPRPKKTNFAIGPTLGFGYGLINNKADLFVGISATWKIFNF